MKASTKKTNICIFEDSGYSDLLPLTHTRPSFELRCGVTTLREKIERLFQGSTVSLMCREHLAPVLREANPNHAVNEFTKEPCLFISGRALVQSRALAALDGNRDCIFVAGDDLVAAALSPAAQAALAVDGDHVLSLDRLEGLPRVEIEGIIGLKYFWQFIHENGGQIEADFAALDTGGEILGTVYPGVTLLEKGNMYIGAGAVIKPGTVLDAEKGPIIIGENSQILPNVTIMGPAAIGPGSVVNAGARIYPETTLGPGCKVGGEIAESIICGYSNKQHDGFLGHAYLGEWVNLGADTNNSDLKNNYSPVMVEINGKTINSGSLFVGCAIGDHSKTGINTMLNTGTVIGAFSNIFGPGFPPKTVASFSWGGAQGLVEHHVDKALETARRVMLRRDQEMSAAREACYRAVHKETEVERNRG